MDIPDLSGGGTRRREGVIEDNIFTAIDLVMIGKRNLKNLFISLSYQYTELQRKVSVLIVYRNFTTADLCNNTKRKLEKVGIKPS